jgi:putative transposase
MMLSYKYRIYPNKLQQIQLDKNFNFCRELYNAALEERISFYKRYKKGISYGSQCSQLPDIKAIRNADCNRLYSQSFQQILKRVDNAYKNFFRRVKLKSGAVGFPRFKSKDRSFSILFPQCDLKSGGITLKDNGKLRIYGIDDDISIKYHRPFQGRCKNVMIKKTADLYYIIAVCDDVPLNILPKTNKDVGIDLGINSFITTDDGTKFHHPKPYKTSKDKLSYRNKMLASKKRGSKNRQKALRLLGKTYEKITNIRKDFHHKTANKIVKSYDKIYMEKLNIAGMLKASSHNVKKSNISDAGWGGFAAILKYKAENAGKLVVEVDPKNTSRMCSCCGKIKKDLALEDRIYKCACGANLDRDINAAKNIKKLGMSFVSKLKV